MGRYERKDSFYKKAKEEGHASRAYYKLGQIQKRYKIAKRGDFVVDLGCAPGGWLEALSKIVGKEGRVVGVDILPIKIAMHSGIKFIRSDINSGDITEKIRDEIGEADVLVSDMAPPTSGVKFRDSYLSYELALRALHIAKAVLKENGNFLVKIFPGGEFAGFKKKLGEFFGKVDQFRPEATRKSSNEIYLIGKGFRFPK